jgi:hypothetical protein
LTALANAGVALPTTYSRTTYANLFAAATATLTGYIFIGSSSISGPFASLFIPDHSTFLLPHSLPASRREC